MIFSSQPTGATSQRTPHRWGSRSPGGLGGEIRAAIAEERRDNAARRSKREADAEAIVAQARQADCEADAVVRSGRPADEIPATATEVGADLIVLGTHGRTGLSQALLGSVALEVLREARQPVLTVGPDAARGP